MSINSGQSISDGFVFQFLSTLSYAGVDDKKFSEACFFFKPMGVIFACPFSHISGAAWTRSRPEVLAKDAAGKTLEMQTAQISVPAKIYRNKVTNAVGDGHSS